MSDSINETDDKERLKETRKTLRILGSLVGIVILAFVIFAVSGGGRYFAARQRKALQNGVSIDLAEILAKETDFHKIHGVYTTDLFALGFAPKAALYKTGFVRPSTEPVPDVKDYDPSRMDLDALKRARPELKIELSKVTKLGEIPFDQVISYCPECTATASTFKAVAAANLDDDAVLDVWTIDEKGETHHLIDDLGSGAP